MKYKLQQLQLFQAAGHLTCMNQMTKYENEKTIFENKRKENFQNHHLTHETEALQLRANKITIQK